MANNQIFARWYDRLHQPNFFKRLFWKVVYYTFRVFSFGMWRPFGKATPQKPASISNSSVGHLTTGLSNTASNIKPPAKVTGPKGQMLVIGAEKDYAEDCRRWDAYCKEQNMEWRELTQHLHMTDEVKLPKIPLVGISQSEALNRALTGYQNYYTTYCKENFAPSSIDCIMIDRVTMQCLMPSNTIYREPGDNKEASDSYMDYAKKGYIGGFYGHIDGIFSKHLLCLMFLNLISMLKPNGKLIFDTQFLLPEHVNILKRYFMQTENWDYNATANKTLEMSKAYGEDYSKYPANKQPRFLEFSGFKGEKIDLDALKQELIGITFPEDLAKKMKPML